MPSIPGLWIVFCLTALGSSVVLSQTCQPEDVARCADPLKLLSDKGLLLATTKKELSMMCQQLKAGLSCVYNASVHCFPLHQRAHFINMYAGVRRINRDLCQKGPLQSEYLRYAPCIKTAQTPYEVCDTEYQRTLSSVNKDGDAKTADKHQTHLRAICCSFEEYLYCSQRVVFSHCGAISAKFAKDYLDRTAGPYVQSLCVNYTLGSPDCAVAAQWLTSPESSAACHTVTMTTILFCILLSWKQFL